MRRLSGVVIAAALVCAAACGKKGNPLPPLRPVPGRVSDLSAVRSEGRITLYFTVPAANVDNTTPAAIDRVDIYRADTLPGAPPPVASVIIGTPANLRSQIEVRRPDPAESTDTPGAPTVVVAPKTPVRPAPGDPASWVDALEVKTLAAGGAYHYVVVPVAGKGRGRPGVMSPVLTVALADLPDPPVGVSLTFNETQTKATWRPTGTATGQVFSVWQTGKTFDPVTAQLLTPQPIAATELSLPVHFDAELCVGVRALRVAGAIRAEGPLSSIACVTPVDRFPPPAPAGLQVVQDGADVTLIWSGVDAADLAGYVVLRGEGAAENLLPLMRAPIQATTYRDTTARAGTTYSYAVYAVDKAPIPNVSQLSARQTVTVR